MTIQADPSARRAEKAPRDRTVLAAVITSVGGVVASAVALVVGNLGVAADVLPGSPTVTTTETLTATRTVTAEPGPGSSVDAAAEGTAASTDRAEQVRLASGSGLDLDAAAPAVAAADGPNGDVDLYWNGSELRANGGELFSWSGSGLPSATDCRESMASGGAAFAYPYLSMTYCFATSTGTVAWFRINDVPESTTHDVVLDVLIPHD